MSHRKKSPQRDLRSHRSAPTPSAVCSVLRPCVRHSKRSRAAAFYAGRHFADPQVYADASDFFADLTLIFRQEIDSLGKAGCPYVQLDEVAIAMLCDPRLRERAKGEGGDADKLIDLYIDATNQALAGRPPNMSDGDDSACWCAHRIAI